jgi:dihydropteroate synthase
MAAISRKTFIGNLLGRAPEARLAGSLALTLFLLRKGASVVRTHDVGETFDALRVFLKMEKDL